MELLGYGAGAGMQPWCEEGVEHHTHKLGMVIFRPCFSLESNQVSETLQSGSNMEQGA